MIVQKFNLEDHFPYLERILALRNHFIPTHDEMPKTGFVVFSNPNTPAAFAFLRMVEGGYAQLDGVATNPNVEKSLRREAMSIAYGACIKTAKEMGLKGLMGFPVAKTTEETAVKHGFEKLPHSIYCLNLKG